MEQRTWRITIDDDDGGVVIPMRPTLWEERDPALRYFRPKSVDMSDEEQEFWSQMPGNRVLDWVGWPSTKPRHSYRHRGWLLQLVLSLVMCGALAAALYLLRW
jgi:hypothetical protein